MKLRHLTKYIFFTALTFFPCAEIFALPSLKQNSTDSSAILKADKIDGDRASNVLTATGNVEVIKDTSVIYADEVTYNQDKKIIHGVGNVRLKNIEMGNMFAREVDVKDDFSSGEFFDSTIVLKDGAYLKSPRIEREDETKTILYNSFFSICPNDEIVQDNEKAGKKRDFAGISSSKTTINRDENVMQSKHGFLEIYNVPILYTPYISVPLPSKKRKSGFLYPSYIRTTNFGFGLKIPYYFDIAPNMDLTSSAQFSLTNGQVTIENDFRHLTSFGDYNLNLLLANNNLNSTRINSAVLDSTNSGLSQRTNKEIRWNLTGNGLFDFDQNLGLDFNLNTVSDINYLRDYNFNYLAYTSSKINLDYVNKRDYYSIKSIRFQELQNKEKQDEEQFILPAIDTYNESNPMFFKERFAFASNVTSIMPDSGLQYRRASFIPEVKLPFNLQGNLFDFNAKLQSDFYWLEQNFRNNRPAGFENYDALSSNFKPEASLTWHLPLIKKNKKSTFIIEPIASFVSSSYTKNNNKTVNADSNLAELSVSNLFISDRISGFDRNESGERVNYGFKSSFYNELGEFGLIAGQSYRLNNANQDVQISGFADNNKSNYVGQTFYKATKYFSAIYSFQLNQKTYSNDINQLSTALNFDRFSISSDYLLLRKTEQNPAKAEQITLHSSLKLSDRWSAKLAMNHDLQLGRTISRSISLNRDGCCTLFGFIVSETNPGSLVKPQQSFSINFTFKNL